MADPAKARDELGWEARTSFEEVVEMMVRADLEALVNGLGRVRDPVESRARSLGGMEQRLPTRSRSEVLGGRCGARRLHSAAVSPDLTRATWTLVQRYASSRSTMCG